MTARRSILALAAFALLLAACAAAPTALAPGKDGGAFGLEGERGSTDSSGPVAAPPAALEPGSVPIPQAFDPTRTLILTANVAMKAEDPWAISDRVQGLVAGLGGDVIGLSQSGTGNERSAMLTVRVPADRFNDALRQIRGLSGVEVLSSNVEAQDVTDQFVDLQARLKAKQAEEARYLELLGRAERIEDILRIDQVLAQVRTEIERLTAQINSINARSQFSTISVFIGTTALPPKPGAWDPASTFAKAIDALVAMVQVAADALIWVLVFGWVPLVLLALALVVSRIRRPVATS